jgi:hypothetical protein
MTLCQRRQRADEAICNVIMAVSGSGSVIITLHVAPFRYEITNPLQQQTITGKPFHHVQTHIRNFIVEVKQVTQLPLKIVLKNNLPKIRSLIGPFFLRR